MTAALQISSAHLKLHNCNVSTQTSSGGGLTSAYLVAYVINRAGTKAVHLHGRMDAPSQRQRQPGAFRTVGKQG